LNSTAALEWNLCLTCQQSLDAAVHGTGRDWFHVVRSHLVAAADGLTGPLQWRKTSAAAAGITVSNRRPAF
jgi:hypothetical protein